MKPYFHKVKDWQFENMDFIGTTWEDARDYFEQPPWCDYPGALDGPMGCWSLCARLVKKQNDCKRCDCYRPDGMAL